VNRVSVLATAFALAACAGTSPGPVVDLSPERWADDYGRFLAAQGVDRSEAGVASGTRGAVTVAYNGLAARAGLEALRQGGNAIDAALTTALTQVALTTGAPISYFGILSLVYYDAGTRRVFTMNAEWNTVRGETEPLTIPGGITMASAQGMRGSAVSGRTALVGGFMKGIEAAHRRFGRLPFERLFQPAIHVAERGIPVTPRIRGYLEFRGDDLKRLPETRAIFTRPDGSFYAVGDIIRQPALARTLRAVAERGAEYMYRGPWAEKLVAMVRADGGRLTMDDLAAYEVIWAEPLVADIGGGYQVHTSPPPNGGGVALIEALNLARAARLVDDGHWTRSAAALRKALDITQLAFADRLPPALRSQRFPGIDFSPEARVKPEHARALWAILQTGSQPLPWAPLGPRHSDDVVAIDARGNVAAITHSINAVNYGKTAIFVDGVSIGDPASFQQAAIARIAPGGRLPAPTETGILFKDGVPILGFASMGSGLHQRTFQALLSVTGFGMTVDQAINAPDFFLPRIDPATGRATVMVASGFPRAVLDSVGYAWEAVAGDAVRLSGEGLWVGIRRDPVTGELRAASHNRNNSAAVAY
jgi:gamma-glutamyltranspeptidase/glutathione hydrolase